MAEWKNREGYAITTDQNHVDLEKLHQYLSQEAYWSIGIPLEFVKKSIENSVCFSVLSPTDEFIGFARVITDLATFGYLGDVFIINEYKGRGLGKWLVKTIMGYSEFKWFRNWFLYTKDAHTLYEKFGWQRLNSLERAMVKRRPAKEIYEAYTSTLHQD